MGEEEMRFLFELGRYEFFIDLSLLLRFGITDWEAECGCGISCFWIFGVRVVSPPCYYDDSSEDDGTIQFEMDDD